MGLTRALVRVRAALTVASEEDLFGTGELWGKFSSFDDAFRSGFQDVHLVAPIVLRGADNVPASDAMG